MRLTLIDLLKAFAAQLIVLHHLVAYDPLAAEVRNALPALGDWLFFDARMAVQVFLVVGGYLAALALTQRPPALLPSLGNRYLRLALPFIGTTFLAILAASMSRPHVPGEMVPPAPEMLQILTHALLLHGVLDYDSLSAGVWYVAIDFQLFALLTVLCICVTQPRLRVWMVGALTTASLLIFNRNAALDDWAIYFFGAYGLGVLVFLLRQTPRRAALLVLGLGVLANLIAFRERIVLATATALLLTAMPVINAHLGKRCTALAAYFSRTSYALFLIHFPLLMLMNTQSGKFPPLLLAAVFWLASNLAADAYYRWVEAPASRVRITARPRPQ